ncbi:hypothetical protein N8I74_03190 [Chitiniphilus purpureus]|uniref:Pirin C-terminal domain-containing protein n=1 Tax=Chitiniphilus purpureus TaxID=2981137 RepID=A0ABY6DSI6_9NEIS|nr:pirin-like C-terminal cupin domain-containing protein [Chitiniphilus sp. CD1]UXY16041.1 hypothetical protein N8I74_03190 [Chitiniphilus sp. CD1]
MHAAQLWIALPPEAHDCPPDFAHHPVLPRWREHGAQLTLLAGSHGGHVAPTRLYSPLLGLDIAADTDTTVTLALDPGFEYGLLPLLGQAALDGDIVKADEFAYLAPGRAQLQLALRAGDRALLLGGRPFAQPVLMWWNFVGFSKAALAKAQRQWEQGDPRFGPVGDGGAARLMPPPLPWRDA